MNHADPTKTLLAAVTLAALSGCAPHGGLETHIGGTVLPAVSTERPPRDMRPTGDVTLDLVGASQWTRMDVDLSRPVPACCEVTDVFHNGRRLTVNYNIWYVPDPTHPQGWRPSLFNPEESR